MDSSDKIEIVWAMVGVVGALLAVAGPLIESTRRSAGQPGAGGPPMWMGLVGSAMLAVAAIGRAEWVFLLCAAALIACECVLFFGPKPQAAASQKPRGRELPVVAPDQAEQKSAIISKPPVHSGGKAPPSTAR